MFRKIGCVLALIGCVFLFGAIGASDAELIGWDRLLLQIDISVLLVVAGGIFLYIGDRQYRTTQQELHSHKNEHLLEEVAAARRERKKAEAERKAE